MATLTTANLPRHDDGSIQIYPVTPAVVEHVASLLDGVSMTDEQASALDRARYYAALESVEPTYATAGARSWEAALHAASEASEAIGETTDLIVLTLRRNCRPWTCRGPVVS